MKIFLPHRAVNLFPLQKQPSTRSLQQSLQEIVLKFVTELTTDDVRKNTVDHQRQFFENHLRATPVRAEFDQLVKRKHGTLALALAQQFPKITDLLELLLNYIQYLLIRKFEESLHIHSIYIDWNPKFPYPGKFTKKSIYSPR